jgi:hypothetical protein
MRGLGIHIGADAGIKLPVIVQYPQSFFAHFLTDKEFGVGLLGKFRSS